MDMMPNGAVHPHPNYPMEQQLRQNAADLFKSGKLVQSTDDGKVNGLHAKIGQLTMENDFFNPKCSVARPSTALNEDRQRLSDLP